MLCLGNGREVTIQLGPLPREITVGVLGIVGCMDLCLRTVILMDEIKSPEVQAVVVGILDISEESMSRGHYAGYASRLSVRCQLTCSLLLPLSWADGVASGPANKARAKGLLRSMKGHYHLNQALLELIINIDWASLNNLALHDWEAFLQYCPKLEIALCTLFSVHRCRCCYCCRFKSGRRYMHTSILTRLTAIATADRYNLG
jgi:hypothetical protein